jgi:hypothetical protein
LAVGQLPIFMLLKRARVMRFSDLTGPKRLDLIILTVVYNKLPVKTAILLIKHFLVYKVELFEKLYFQFCWQTLVEISVEMKIFNYFVAFYFSSIHYNTILVLCRVKMQHIQYVRM